MSFGQQQEVFAVGGPGGRPDTFTACTVILLSLPEATSKTDSPAWLSRCPK